MYVSKCCKKTIYVEGFCTRYYVCNGCGRACDITECQLKQKNAGLEKYLNEVNRKVAGEEIV